MDSQRMDSQRMDSPPQPSGCDPELTGLAGAPLLRESLDAKEIRRVVRPCYAVLAQSLDASKVARLHLLVHMCG